MGGGESILARAAPAESAMCRCAGAPSITATWYACLPCVPPRSDFYYEFQQALQQSQRFPANTKMLVLCSRPSFEFGAFQVGGVGSAA